MVLIIGIIVFLFILTIICTGYVKARPDEAIIISGLRDKPRMIIGRATVMIPFLERKDKISMQAFKVDVKTSEPVPNKDYIHMSVDAVAVVRISENPDIQKNAVKNFLNQKTEYIQQLIREPLEAAMRSSIGTLSVEDIVQNREMLITAVQESTKDDMDGLGVEIISFNIQNFSDTSGVIQNLGIDNTARIQKEAAIVKSAAQRDIQIAESAAQKQANDARVAAEQEIAIKNNQLEIKKANLKAQADQEKARADKAYEIEKEIQRKTVEIAQSEADLAREERQIAIKEQSAKIKEKELEATIKKQAEAERFAKEQAAEADLYQRQKEAEAKKIEKEKDAEAKRYEVEQEAEAMKKQAEAKKFQLEQEAEGIKAKGFAEAEAIKAKGLAEAEGIAKKAEAMKQMETAAILEMYFKVLPEVAANVAKPLENIDRITMYGEGNTAKMVGDITKSTTQITEGLTAGLGIDVKSMLAGFLGGKMATDKTVETETVDVKMPTTEQLNVLKNLLGNKDNNKDEPTGI